MMAANAVAQLGNLCLTLNDVARPGWLMMDGATEYERAAYPAFVAKFSAAAWFLGGSAAAKFRILDIRDLVLIGAGGLVKVGEITGAKEVRLTTANLPEHDHGYERISIGNPTKISFITQILNGIAGSALVPTLSSAPAATAKAGRAAPDAIPLTPRAMGANVFVFAGLPKAA